MLSRLPIILWLVVSLCGDQLALAVPLPAPAPVATPACPLAFGAEPAALRQTLPGATYACTEDLALALREHLAAPTLAWLIELAEAGPNALAQRNALRVIGRLASAPANSHTAELIQRRYGSRLRQLALNQLAQASDNFVLQDAIWLLDQTFFPTWSARGPLANLALNPNHSAAVRSRATRAYSRLVLVHPLPTPRQDRLFFEKALQTTDYGVQAEAALALMRLLPEQLAETKPQLLAALQAAEAALPPLSLAVDPLDAPIATALRFEEPLPTALIARAAIAQALDQHQPQQPPRFEMLQSAYEQLALPERIDDGAFQWWLAETSDLDMLRGELAAAREQFAQISQHELAAVPPLRWLILPSRASYREYLWAFFGLRAAIDGLYRQADATVLSYRRQPMQTEHTLAASLRHELAHHLMAHTVIPLAWGDPQRDREPLGWADEGIAEVLAAAAPSALRQLCGNAAAPSLAQLLAQRIGYDQGGGRFAYAEAWALSAFLAAEQPAALPRLYAAIRTQRYQRSAWAQLAGFSDLMSAEQAWHAWIAAQCR